MKIKIKVDFKERGYEDVDRFTWFRIGSNGELL
jgi:hypothetical protein